MSKRIQMDQFHLTVYAPSDLPQRQLTTISRTLGNQRFQKQLRKALRAVIKSWPNLRNVRIGLSR